MDRRGGRGGRACKQKGTTTAPPYRSREGGRGQHKQGPERERTGIQWGANQAGQQPRVTREWQAREEGGSAAKELGTSTLQQKKRNSRTQLIDGRQRQESNAGVGHRDGHQKSSKSRATEQRNTAKQARHEQSGAT